MNLLKFGKGNSKLDKEIATFTIPSGSTCPGAKLCKAQIDLDRPGRKIKDGKHQQYRCFMVGQEQRYSGLYKLTRYNIELLLKQKTFEDLRNLIVESLKPVLKNGRIKAVRVHVGGDFFNQRYFDAWMSAASRFKSVTFYAYTKSLKFWINAKDRDLIPVNFKLTASEGGHFDHLIEEHGLRKATVVMHPEEAAALNVEIDHDDSHARGDGGDFSLLLHGSQPAGSPAAQALKRMREEGIEYSYKPGFTKKKTEDLPEKPIRTGFTRKKTPAGSEATEVYKR